MSQREIAAAAAKKYILSITNTTASAPTDSYHPLITPITLGKADQGESINREDFLLALLTEFLPSTRSSSSRMRSRIRSQ